MRTRSSECLLRKTPDDARIHEYIQESRCGRAVAKFPMFEFGLFRYVYGILFRYCSSGMNSWSIRRHILKSLH